jgi:uroporphyrinogen-III decarboxylase
LTKAEKRAAFIVALGCDLSPETPLENILSFVEAMKSTSIYTGKKLRGSR